MCDIIPLKINYKKKPWHQNICQYCFVLLINMICFYKNFSQVQHFLKLTLHFYKHVYFISIFFEEGFNFPLFNDSYDSLDLGFTCFRNNLDLNVLSLLKLCSMSSSTGKLRFFIPGNLRYI